MIVGLIGYARVGKSTAASHLERNYGFVRHNFKDGLVAELKQNFPDLLGELTLLYDMSIQELFDQKPPAMRALMRNYGTEVRRGDRNSYWIDEWTKKAIELSKEKHRVVVDDVRFKNEGFCVKAHGGILIRLTRPDITTGGNHKSETEQLSIEADYTIPCNPGDHEKLYEELDRIVSSLRGS